MQNRHKTQNVTLHSHYKVTLLTIYNINIYIPLISIKTKGKRENKKRESHNAHLEVSSCNPLNFFEVEMPGNQSFQVNTVNFQNKM